jgi:predicted phosphodiesterase
MKILHLTDAHFGKTHFISGSHGTTLSTVLANDLQAADPDLIVLSGDLTWGSTLEQYEETFAFLEELRAVFPKPPVVLVPGNHDVFAPDLLAGTGMPSVAEDRRQDGFRQLVERFHGAGFATQYPLVASTGQLSDRQRLVSIIDNSDCLVIGVNSAALLATGSEPAIGTPVGMTPPVFRALDGLMQDINRREPADPRMRVFVLHHHLLPFADPDWTEAVDLNVIGRRPDPTMTADSGHLQAWLAEHSFQLVLHGHKHVAHGRVDRLWTRTTGARPREILVVGGGSCGVQRSHRPEAEPLSYNVIELSRRGNEGIAATVTVRSLDLSMGAHRAANFFGFDVLLKDDRSALRPKYYSGQNAAECHSAIAAELRDVPLIRNFMSVVESATYVHPTSIEIAGVPMGLEAVRAAFRTLQPDLAAPGAPRNRRLVGGRAMRYQLEHGNRLFQSQVGDPDGSGFDAALNALTGSPGGRRSYVGLFMAEADTRRNAEEPPPGLVGVQFYLEDPGHSNVLHLTATFRHLELSFWWAVNVYEACELLEYAAPRIPGLDQKPSLGTITFFAAQAGWEKSPDPTGCAELDTLDGGILMALVADGIDGKRSELDRLVRLLREKASYTNVANVETVGVAELVAMVHAMRPTITDGPLRSRWEEIAAALDDALKDLDTAVTEPGHRMSATHRAVTSLRTAAEAIEGLSI